MFMSLEWMHTSTNVVTLALPNTVHTLYVSDTDIHPILRPRRTFSESFCRQGLQSLSSCRTRFPILHILIDHVSINQTLVGCRTTRALLASKAKVQLEFWRPRLQKQSPGQAFSFSPCLDLRLDPAVSLACLDYLN